MSGGKKTEYEAAEDCTLYWTLSLYVRARRIYGPYADGAEPTHQKRAMHDPERVRELQRLDDMSRVLRDAIEPLFNDVADRETQGNVHDFLFAAAERGDAETEDDAVRAALDVNVRVPPEVRWTTEGKTFSARPPGLDQQRSMRLRRFWFVHNDGAVSYHLSFSVTYRHTAADYFFIGLLQKLAAPKEFALRPELQKSNSSTSVFVDGLGIDPLDRMEFCSCVGACLPSCQPRRFWTFVDECLFAPDAKRFFARYRPELNAAEVTLSSLVELVPLIEVPGLSIPSSRFMFLFRDERFFRRLNPPVNPLSGERYPRKMMVQDHCFAPYSERLSSQVQTAQDRIVCLHEEFWDWVVDQPDWEWHKLSDADVDQIRNGGGFEWNGKALHIPSFERQRGDCLDYLFLSGFNQNIIDFMNQDTSEILDGIDPIYPATLDQKNENFFVRYANHRAMITYLPRSRSLEVGNDYIGTCPYAFLIHALAMHNELLAKDHEESALRETAAIRDQLDASQQLPNWDYEPLERRINQVKLSNFWDYERYRHGNVFRYDTERDVFAGLEQLRGTARRQDALLSAVINLEEHARDIERRQKQKASVASEEQGKRLNALLGAISILTFVQTLFEVGHYFEDHPQSIAGGSVGKVAESVAFTLGNVAWLLATLILLVIVILAAPMLKWTWSNRRQVAHWFWQWPRHMDAGRAESSSAQSTAGKDK